MKKIYSYNNGKQIWRIIPGGKNKLIIEERNDKDKEAFFNCIEINTGKNILSNFQLEDKFWVGIESVYNNIIFFHKFIKPDLPIHQGIIAFDLTTNKILWQNNEVTFFKILNKFLFAYNPTFESRNYYKLNYETGELLEELSDNFDVERLLKENDEDEIIKNFIFAEIYNNNSNLSENIRHTIKEFKEENLIVGNIEFVSNNNLLLLSAHFPQKNGLLNKVFQIVDILTGKIIFKKNINSNISKYIPDSFFLINDLLFVISNSQKITVFRT